MPTDPHSVLDASPPSEARELLNRCCGARRWVEGMLQRLPFGSTAALLCAADQVWAELGREDYLEAFSHHPRIGEDLGALRRRFQNTSQLSAAEQAGVSEGNEATLNRLRELNVAYAERFGYIFIVCATGKSAQQMLELLEARLHNSPARELAVAAVEQAKITRLRLENLAP